MSDKPLFDDMDEQERETGDASDIAMENAALGLAAGAIGPGSGTNPSAPGPAAGVGPALGATAIVNELHDEDDSTPER